MNRIWCLALAAVAVAAAGGCGSVRDGTALDLGQSHFQVCMPAPSDGDNATFGDTMVRNVSDGAVTIIEVKLVEPQDLTLIDALLVEVGPDESLVGIRRTSDPEHLPARWDERLPAAGAVVRPGEEWNLVLVVDPDSDDTAVAEAARISYRDPDGRRYRQDTFTTILVTHRTCEEALRRTDD